jgi:hypothetical protein
VVPTTYDIDYQLGEITMGRPLNKKYFGNRNIGSTSVTTDNGIGGQGVASAAVITKGSYQTRPVITFTAPQLPNGVTATGTITSEVLSAAVSGTQTGTYLVGDLITVSTPGGSAIAYVATLSTGAVATVNFTGTGAYAGDFTSLTAGGACTATGGSGAGVVLTLTYRAKTVVITDPGSGYSAAPTATATLSVTINTITMLASSAVGGQEPAIIPQAFIATQSLPGDIIKQVSGYRYKVITSESVNNIPTICKLVAATPAAVGEMVIPATDSTGNTYFVTKLTNHRAVLTQAVLSTTFQFATGSVANWTFGTAVVNVSVKITNA